MGLSEIFHSLIYHIWRRNISKYLDIRKDLNLIDCGTGPGHLIGLLEKWFPQIRIFGLDIDPDILSRARTACRRGKFTVASAEWLPFADRSFDGVISLHMIEHLYEPERFLSEAARVLRPGGLFIIATPNPAGLGSRIRKSRWSGWCPEHVSLKPPDEWRYLLTHHGFAILKNGTTGLSGIPIFRKFPLGLFNWGPLFLFGFFPWNYGEAYVSISKKARW